MRLTNGVPSNGKWLKEYFDNQYTENKPLTDEEKREQKKQKVMELLDGDDVLLQEIISELRLRKINNILKK